MLKRGQEELPQLLAAAVGPALNMDHEEVQVESIFFWHMQSSEMRRAEKP